MSSHDSSHYLPPPAVPVSCGAILLDGQGKLLIVKPTYKSGWSIPGGSMEPDGESPWDACRREVLEETGLTVARGRLVVIDTRPHEKRQLGLRFLFHCGTVAPEDAARITVQPEELSEYRFAPIPEALELLRPAISRRVAVGLQARTCVYLENGRRAAGIIG
ncbi:NUDIX domain-containing protein [Luteococcus sp. Sow4_B9]|uniref:NUDIX domain-containing protein n=1 Tax=Luteococcus sp. Sow4_B9 TaxID=3438792 RepID=UPI003F9CBD7F